MSEPAEMRHCRRNTAQESVEETRAPLQPRRAGEICERRDFRITRRFDGYGFGVVKGEEARKLVNDSLKGLSGYATLPS